MPFLLLYSHSILGPSEMISVFVFGLQLAMQDVIAANLESREHGSPASPVQATPGIQLRRRDVRRAAVSCMANRHHVGGCATWRHLADTQTADTSPRLDFFSSGPSPRQEAAPNTPHAAAPRRINIFYLTFTPNWIPGSILLECGSVNMRFHLREKGTGCRGAGERGGSRWGGRWGGRRGRRGWTGDGWEGEPPQIHLVAIDGDQSNTRLAIGRRGREISGRGDATSIIE